MKKAAWLLLGALLAGAIIWRTPVNGPWPLVWLLGMIVMGVIRAPHEKENKQNVIQSSEFNRIEKLLLIAVWLGSAPIPATHLLFGVFPFANTSIPVWVSSIGVLCLVVGLWLFWRSHRDLGRNWSVTLEIREDHNLVDEGVYKRIRHPMYSAIALIFIAQATLINNWFAGYAGLVTFFVMYMIRVPREEEMMRQKFGDAYRTYEQTTGRLIPKL
ncbi:MAG: protein-S-isoprenylcysteine O-methyltransferase [Pseudomonadota bacterium]